MAPGIHIVCAGGYLQCATYLIDGPTGAVLVDPGSSSCEEEILKNIARLGRKIEDVKYALLTHCHVDHALGAYRFREMGVKLVSSRYTARILRDAGREVWYEYPDWVVPTQVDVVANNEDDLPLCGLHVCALGTSGHTPGCMSYLMSVEGGMVAFTGDLYGASGHLSWAGSVGFSARRTLRSLEKLRWLSPEWIFTGHGPVQIPATEWLDEAIRKGRAGEWVVNAEFHPDAVPDSRLLVAPPHT